MIMLIKLKTSTYENILYIIHIQTNIKITHSEKEGDRQLSPTLLSSSTVEQITYPYNFTYLKLTLLASLFFTQTNSVNSKQIILIIKYRTLLQHGYELCLSYSPLLIAGFRILGNPLFLFFLLRGEEFLSPSIDVTNGILWSKFAYF